MNYSYGNSKAKHSSESIASNFQGASQNGFTLGELTIVLLLLAILAALTLPHMLDTRKEIHGAAVKHTSGALAAALVLARSQWLSNGMRIAVDGIEGYGNSDVATSTDGWPTDSHRGNASEHNPVFTSAARCERLWQGLLNAQAPTVSSNAAVGSDYLVEVKHGNCRYQYRKTEDKSYILYNARTGEVTTRL